MNPSAFGCTAILVRPDYAQCVRNFFLDQHCMHETDAVQQNAHRHVYDLLALGHFECSHLAQRDLSARWCPDQMTRKTGLAASSCSNGRLAVSDYSDYSATHSHLATRYVDR